MFMNFYAQTYSEVTFRKKNEMTVKSNRSGRKLDETFPHLHNFLRFDGI